MLPQCDCKRIVNMRNNWREITLGHTHYEFGDNSIRSTKLTLMPFLISFILNKSCRTLNLWFVLASVLQMVFPDLHEWEPWATLVFFGSLVLIGFVKEMTIEVLKTINSAAANRQPYSVWTGADFKNVRLQSLHAGQILKVADGDLIPADLVLLATSRTDFKCFVNLRKLTEKPDADEKTTLNELAEVSENLETDPKIIERLEGVVEVALPNPDFENFEGSLKLRGFPRGIKLGVKQLLPRGAVLINTEWVLGVVVYVGNETKMRLSQDTSKRKPTKLERFTNLAVTALIFGAVIFSFICAAVSETKMKRNDRSYNYGEHLVGFLVTFQRVVPITLYAVLALARQLCRAALSPHFIVCNSRVLDNLGHVEYILAGKSGVMTTDRVSLKLCVLGNNEYWREASQKPDLEDCGDKTKIIWGTSATYSAYAGLGYPIEGMLADSPDDGLTLVLAIVLCCSSKISKAPFDTTQNSALLEGVKSQGYVLQSFNNDKAEISTPYGPKSFEVFLALEADDCTYAIVVSALNQHCRLYVKGEIEAIERLFRKSEDDHVKLDQLFSLSKAKGLEIVVFAYKDLSFEQATEIKSKADWAMTGGVNQEGRIKDALEEALVGLKILGSTGLQEEINPEVADTLSEITRAGSKLWLVSSDNENSLVSCGLSLGLIRPDSQVLALSHIDTQFHLKRTLIKGIRRYIFDAEGLPLSNLNTLEHDSLPPRRLNKLLNFTISKAGKAKIYKALSLKGEAIHEILEEPFETNDINFSVILDGMTFNTAIRDPECRMLLACCLFPSNSVLAYGFMPHQKAELVRLLQDNLAFKPIVLALGEGYKDEPMIREADIGISMETNHNLEADILIRRFQSLSWLVNERGRQISASLSRVVCLSLYKNLAFTLALCYYNFLCDFSGTQLYSSLMAAGLDLFFTVLPLIIVAFDRVSKGVQLTARLAGKYAALALAHSGVVVLYAVSVSDTVLDRDGTVMSVAALGLLVYASLMLAFYFQVLIEVETSNLQAALGCFLSAAAMFICLAFAYPADFAVITSSTSALIAMFFAPLSCGTISLASQQYTKRRNQAKVAPKPTCSNRVEAYKNSLLKVYRNSQGWKSADEAEAFSINLAKLTFTSKNAELVYNKTKAPSTLSQTRMFFVVSAPLFGGWLILVYCLQGLPVGLMVFRASIVGFMLISLALSYTRLKYNHISSIAALCTTSIALIFIFVLVEDSFPDIGFALASIIIPLVYFVRFVHVVVFVALSVILAQIAFVVGSSFDNDVVLSTLFFYQLCILLSVAILSVAGGYSVEHSSRDRFRLTQITRLEVEKTQAILGFLLPAFVRDRVREGARYIAEDQGTVSILFCDIYDFDRICAEYSPKELTDFLDDLFRKFDYLCDAHGVTKIETVGKTYMACAGLKDSEADLPVHLVSRSHARRVTDMALDIVRTCSTRMLKYGQPLQVKIGLNSGPVTAGVVGYHKPQFSLVGDTVNTASRMCSTLSQTNGIQITEDVFKLIGWDVAGLAFEDSSVEAKGKGTIATKLVTEDLHIITPPIVHVRSSTTITRRAQRASVSEESAKLYAKDTELVNDILSFTCKESAKQAAFRAKFIERNLLLIKLGLYIGFALNASLTVIDVVQLIKLDNYTTLSLVICRICLSGSYFTGGVLTNRLFKMLQFRWATTSLATIHTVVAFINLMEDTKEPHTLVLIEAMFVVVFASNSSGCFFKQIISVNAVIFFLWVLLAPWVSDGLDFIGESLSLLLVITANLYVAYLRERSARDFANLQIASQKQIDRTESLLTQMMPARVYENLKNDRELTERLEGVCLLFADIVGFTAWSSDKAPVEVVGMLSELFTQFDRMAVEFGVYKVHTIGDCYVVMNDTTLDKRNPQHDAKIMVEFAFSMLATIKQINEEHNSQLNMRIGVHYGELIAGITGTNLVRYDIYGPDVIIANKMESGGQAGRLNVSDVVRELIKQGAPDAFDFEFNAEIHAKSVNRKHNSFFVTVRE